MSADHARTLFLAALPLGLVAAAFSSGGETVPAAGSWPEFHGARRDNMSLEKNLAGKWPADGPPLLWRAKDCGAGYAGVSIADGLIFTSGDFGPDEMVLALDGRGRTVWRAPNGRSWRGAAPGARCTPTYRDGIVYHANPTGRVAAFRARSGRAVWAVDLAERFGVDRGAWALSENLAVDGDLVFCVPGGARGRIVALDRRSGRTVWANTEIEEGAGYCSPIVVTHRGVRQLITLVRRSVVAVDVVSGSLLWRHDHRTPYQMNVTMPRFRDGRVFITSGYAAGGRLLEIGEGSRSVRELWHTKELDNCHTGVLLLGEHLYGSGCRQSKRGFVCVDLASGKTAWTDRDIWKVSFTYADGKLYCLGHEGRMVLLEVSPAGPHVRSHFQLPKRDRYDCLAHPVVCGGRMYIRQGADLLCYDVTAR